VGVEVGVVVRVAVCVAVSAGVGVGVDPGELVALADGVLLELRDGAAVAVAVAEGYCGATATPRSCIFAEHGTDNTVNADDEGVNFTRPTLDVKTIAYTPEAGSVKPVRLRESRTTTDPPVGSVAVAAAIGKPAAADQTPTGTAAAARVYFESTAVPPESATHIVSASCRNIPPVCAVDAVKPVRPSELA